MADDPSVAAGKAIDDAYSRAGSAGVSAAPLVDPQVSAGKAIDDAYRTQDASAPPAPPKKGWADYYLPTGTVDEYGNVQAPLATAPTPPSSLEDLRAQIQAGETNVLRRLASGPETGPVEDFARHAAGTGVVLLSKAAQFPVNALMGITGGGGWSMPSSLTIDPNTGKLDLTPEALAAAQLLTGGGPAGRDVRFTPPGEHPLQFVPPARSGGPLPPDTAANLLSPDARVRATEPAAGPTTSTGVPVTPPAPVAAPSAAPSAPADNALVTPSISPTAAPSARITPIVTQAQAEAEADRILRHFAGDQTPVINSAPLASGAQPTLSQAVEGGHSGLAGLERGVRDVPEQNQHFVARETANTTLRNKAVGEVIGDSRDTDVTEAELNKRTAPQEAAIFDPAKTTPVDPSDAIAMLDQIRSSGKGQRDAVANALDHLRGKLIDKDGNMQTDPAQLRGVDLAIKDMISPMAAGTKQDGRAAAHELMAVRDVLRDNIEQGAPGYKDFLAQQAAERSAIDGQRFLQARNITDRQGNVNLGTLDSTIKAAERQQAMPGARLADGVTDEQLDKLRQLRADYQNDAKQRLGTSIGSPTVQKFGVSGSMGVMGHPLLAGGAGVAGAWAAGVSNPLLGAVLGGAGYLMKQQSLKGQRMVMDALRDKLLNPEKARSAFPPP